MKTIYHFIGIGGIGMSGLARILLSQNQIVSGSDLKPTSLIEELIREGIIFYKGHSKNHIPKNGIVIYSSDILPENPEILAAKEKHCTLLHRSELLAKLLENKISFGIAGTHGKTTTTSILTNVFIEANLDPSFAIGGILPSLGTNARFGTGPFFSFEACESDRSFLNYFPDGTILTNINDDHLINYEGKMEKLIQSFHQFINQVKNKSYILWCKDNEHLYKLNPKGQSYGFHPKSDWKIENFFQNGFSLIFDLIHGNQKYKAIEIPLTGYHNISNAAAVFALTYTLGIPEDKIRQSFKSFHGVLRRCERKKFLDEILFFDDYAHHPTEIQTTLEGIRLAIGSKKLIAIFQPHRYSRTKDCLGKYRDAFASADEIIITDIYSAGEKSLLNISHKNIQQEIKIPCKYLPRTSICHYLKDYLKPHDVVITLGAGDITFVAKETLSILSNSQ